MILAIISGETFVLPSLKDAELLLQIFERATPVRTGYIETEGFRNVVYASGRAADINVAISPSELITAAQYDELKAADRTAATTRKTEAQSTTA